MRYVCVCILGRGLTACFYKEKRELFRSWLQNGKNLDATESALVISKSKATETCHQKELLTIAEMVAKGFSKKGP